MQTEIHKRFSDIPTTIATYYRLRNYFAYSYLFYVSAVVQWSQKIGIDSETDTHFLSADK